MNASDNLLSYVQVLSKVNGKTLVGTNYQPLFPYFAHLKANAPLQNGTAANGVQSMSSGAFRVISDGYVKDDSGTGVVHQAPAFGEDDFRICIENGKDCRLLLPGVWRCCVQNPMTLLNPWYPRISPSTLVALRLPCDRAAILGTPPS